MPSRASGGASYFDAGGRSDSPLSTTLFTALSSHTSVIPSISLSYRRKSLSDMPTVDKSPLLILKLSSPSFLDSQVTTSDSAQDLLYEIKTQGTSTIVTRPDPWEGPIRTADIKWPKIAPEKGKGRDNDGVLVQMHGGRWKCGEALLKPGGLLSSPRKFNIPGYSRALKWKSVGRSYWCISPSVKGPIATLDPSVSSSLPLLKIYETLYAKYDTRPDLVHRGVSVLLLDYLIVTALLLVTDVQEWMVVRKYEGEPSSLIIPKFSVSTEGSSPLSPSASSTSVSQWRKILYGQPLFPRRFSTAESSEVLSPTPSSVGPDQMAKILYREPIYPHLRSPSPDLSLSLSSSDSDDDDDESPIVDMPVQMASPALPSTSSESLDCNPNPSAAPSQARTDPSSYRESHIPPVPPIPLQYASNRASSASMRRRELPLPPLSSTSRPVARSRSTPPREDFFYRQQSVSAVDVSVSAPSSRRPSQHSIVRTQSMRSTPSSGSIRQLPTPPTQPSSFVDSRPLPILRHAQSSSKPLGVSISQKRFSIHGRSLPPTPISAPVGFNTHSEQQRLQRLVHKQSDDDVHDELTHWLAGSSQAVVRHQPASFDAPPPAYNSINFSSGYEMAIMSATTSNTPQL